MLEMLGILIVLNNYFHDVATAVLLSSAVIMLVVARHLERNPSKELVDYFVKIYGVVSRFAVFALIWIVVGGIPRTIFFKRIEWPTAVGKGLVLALVIKHLAMFLAVGAGVVLWLRLRKKVLELNPPQSPFFKGGSETESPFFKACPERSRRRGNKGIPNKRSGLEENG